MTCLQDSCLTLVNLPCIADGEDKSSPFKNRVRKNYRHIRKWAKRTNTNCFRLYDREIREYPLAIDFYGGKFCIHYFSRAFEEGEAPLDLVQEVENAITEIFSLPSREIYWRTHKKRKETRQYEKIGEAKEFFTVVEFGVKFEVNLLDYLDTGLFLDHRETRNIFASYANGKRVLNLFSYTASFSVHAAIKGAIFTKSVDMSNTYSEWGRRNFEINSLSSKNNVVVRADCLKFLDEEISTGNKYDLIIVDPPTISRSKKMDQLFDIQVDYITLLSKALGLLSKDGILFFSTNSRKFVFDDSHFLGYSIVDISKKTLPLDFHDPKIHRCWKFQSVSS